MVRGPGRHVKRLRNKEWAVVVKQLQELRIEKEIKEAQWERNQRKY